MRELYPNIEPYSVEQLDTGSEHTVYFEQVGNPVGVPIVFLHGGPGSGCNENHRRYFDSKKYRIILFDQRGCNRSLPNGLVDNNSTQALLADMESIRKKLKIKQWVLFGGSWGATLALLYAEQYPQCVAGMILRGTFLARQCDFEWFAKSGANKIFPDYWQTFISRFDHDDGHQAVAELHEAVFSENRARQLKAAKTWALWAGRIVTHSITNDYVLEVENEDRLINEVRIEMHYAINHYFIKDNQIINDIANLPAVPIKIIHGRKDLTCLPEAGWTVHQSIPGSQLTFVPEAGHLASEPTMINALIDATDEMAELLR